MGRDEMNAPRVPKYDYRSEGARWLLCSLWVLILFGIAAFIYYASEHEVVRVAQIVKNLECVK